MALAQFETSVGSEGGGGSGGGQIAVMYNERRKVPRFGATAARYVAFEGMHSFDLATRGGQRARGAPSS